jgi:hypothetical protein
LAGADNSGGERAITEAAASQAATEPLFEVVLGGGDVMMVFAERTTPPTLPTKELEAVVPAVIENPVPVEAQAGGSAMEVSATDTMCAINFKVINLDTPDLSSNDRDIYEAVLESMLANPVELGVEAPESAAPAAASSDEAMAPVGGSPRWVPPRWGSFRRSKLETLEVPCAQPHRRQ